MARRLFALLVALLPGIASAERPNMPLADYLARMKQLSAEHRTAQRACGANPSSDRDICLARALGADRIAKADLEVAYRSTPRTRFEASEARAQALFWVARERCIDAAHSTRAACLHDADAALADALASAEVLMKAGEAARVADAICADTTATAVQRRACSPGAAPIARPPPDR